MEQLNTIKELISQGNVEQAILLLDELLQTDFPQKTRPIISGGTHTANRATGSKR